MRALARLMAGASTSEQARRLVADRRPDVVVADCMTPAPLRGALETGTPTVALFHTFGAYWVDTFDGGATGRILGMRGLRPMGLWAQCADRLLLTDAELDPAGGDARLSGTWTGTTEVGAGPLPRGTRPRILVALSSSSWPGMLPVYRRIVEALAGLPVDAVVTTGGVDLGGELAAAPNVEVRGWAPHAELLPTVDLVVGHGGHSTTMKALAHGVPLLVLPVNPTADQRLIGPTLQSAGVGQWLPKNARPTAVRDAVAALLDDTALRARAGATGRRLRGLPSGAEVAAERILAAVG